MSINLRKNKKLVIAFLTITVFFSIFFIKECFSQERELIELTSEIWSGQKILDGEYVLGKRQIISIEKGTEIIFTENSSLSLDGGVMDAVGTQKEPIIFRSDTGSINGYHIFINDSSGIYFKNVDISGGGRIEEENIPPALVFIKKVLAAENRLGVLSKTGESVFIMDNCFIHGNSIGIKLFDLSEDSYVKVNRTRFFNNQISVIAENNKNNFLDFSYNFWENDNKEGLIKDSNSKEEKNFKDPVILIPGIMGSTKKNGRWLMDPILGTYDDLNGAFLESGYDREEDFFPFPYQWRNSNVDNAVLLKEKIQEIKNKTNSNKVDIVAHSMGGLLAREYVESDSFMAVDDVDQLITLGTPHNGSPEIYSTWEAGEFIPDLMGSVKKKYFQTRSRRSWL